MALISASGNPTMGARAAWHWAFETGISSIDMREVLDSFGVQFTAKGADGKIMEQCEKGRIQQVIDRLKYENKLAWAWGMLAYAPENTVNPNELRGTLFPWVMNAVSTNKFNPFMSAECGKLAFVATHDAAIEVRAEGRYSRKRKEMAALLGCDVETYRNIWAPRLYRMKDRLKDLDGSALIPVMDAIFLMADKALGHPGSDSQFIEAMRTAQPNY